ncbi:MAG: ATP-binding protein [Rickettsiella sp.]|nr:ATP-binding protein [Rickettsiella sp.]
MDKTQLFSSIEQVFELIPGNAYIKDVKGHYLVCNTQQLKLLGVTSIEALRGKTDKDLYPKHIAENFIKMDEEIIATHQEQTLQEIGIGTDGNEKIFSIKKRIFYNENRAVVGIIGIGIDITEMKKAEDKVFELDTIISQFPGQRTPLTGILGCAHLIQAQASNAEKVTEYAIDLVASGNALIASLMKNKVRQIVVKLSISDSGVGIPLEKRHEVYTRFKRLVPSYQGNYSGTGLGLSVVKQFIDDLGAEIYLSSNQSGSIFTCLIPFQAPLLTNEVDDEDQQQPQVFVPKLECFQNIPILDMARAFELMGNQDLVQEGLTLLVNGLNEELKQLKQHHRKNDWTAIRALVHKWKGGASYCGTRRLEQACLQLETYLEQNCCEEAEGFYAQLIQVAEMTKHMVRKYT